MEPFNTFVEKPKNKPLKRLLDSLDENDGIMLESMFHSYASYVVTQQTSLNVAMATLKHLTQQYKDFCENVGKNDPTTKHIKGKIEGMEFMIKSLNLKKP